LVEEGDAPGGGEEGGRDPFDRSGGLGGTAGVVVSSDRAEGGDVVVAVGNPTEMLRLLERRDALAVTVAGGGSKEAAARRRRKVEGSARGNIK
jgi:hypothetical protein